MASVLGCCRAGAGAPFLWEPEGPVGSLSLRTPGSLAWKRVELLGLVRAFLRGQELEEAWPFLWPRLLGSVRGGFSLEARAWGGGREVSLHPRA